jgi:hypothetical protein
MVSRSTWPAAVLGRPWRNENRDDPTVLGREMPVFMDASSTAGRRPVVRRIPERLSEAGVERDEPEAVRSGRTGRRSSLASLVLWLRCDGVVRDL